MLTCKKATRLMSDSLDRPLGRGERLNLRLHLFFCRGCRAFRSQIGWLREISHGFARWRGDGNGKD